MRNVVTTIHRRQATISNITGDTDPNEAAFVYHNLLHDGVHINGSKADMAYQP